MQQTTTHYHLTIDNELYKLVNDEIIPKTGIESEQFWNTLEAIIAEFSPKNKALLDIRDSLQKQIDDWHLAHSDGFDQNTYKQFLKDIGYLQKEVPDFKIDTNHIDPEIATISAPQLVVPINNARFSLNATNARWGSLFDAFYGTDVIANKNELKKGNIFNPKRGEKVLKLAYEFLDTALPLVKGEHSMVSTYALVNESPNGTSQKQFQCILSSGETVSLKHPKSFVGYKQDIDKTIYLFKHNHLHFEIHLDASAPISKLTSTGKSDIILEAAVTTIQDLEDSVCAVDAEDKLVVYRNWLHLMNGTLEVNFKKSGQQVSRRLNPDRHYLSPLDEPFSLSGRSLLLVRHVGLYLMTDAVLYKNKEIPEGILDALITTLAFLHDYQGDGVYKNSPQNNLYIVKPKLHGADEVRFTVDLFSRIEQAFKLPKNTLKLGIMDEERRTTVNLKNCIYEARERLVFINTGFLDRTGDEIHTSMEAGVFLPKAELKMETWLNAYEDWNVDIGLACGLQGKAQIGKGMWAMPDLMSDMLKTKVQHPQAGANCAWVPSPTAATLHAIHYHQVDVWQKQNKLMNREHAKLDDILTLALIPKSEYIYFKREIEDCIENNAQSILGYVVRWINQGIGCSKVPDKRHIGLMEDLATLRISSQIMANWLHHQMCNKEQLVTNFKKMAILVDKQNADDPFYHAMSPDFENSIAFNTSLDLVFKGCKQANGYTELLLREARRQVKQAHLAS